MTRSVWIFLFLLTLIGCNEEDAVPAYLHLTEWDFTVKPGQGTDFQIIKSAHVFVEGKSIGVYQVPSTIPIVGDGPTNIDVLPMIKQNGMQDLDAIFPYFEPMDTVLNLTPTEGDTLQLATRYRDFTEFVLIEDFETRINFSEDLDQDLETSVQKERTDVFEGSVSGRIVLSEDHPIIEAGYDTLITNTVGHGSYWVEMNYKTNIVFVAGVVAYLNGAPIKYYQAGVNPKNEWNKIYFDLTDIYLQEDRGVYQLTLVGVWDESLGDEEGVILVDNIKLLRTD